MDSKLYQEYLDESEGEQPSKLASDYLFGFDIGDDFERWYLELAITNGFVPQEDIEHFTRQSLLRGLEEWHQMLCCANAMREKASMDDPLDGRDLLTFISKIFVAPFGSPKEDVGSSAESTHRKGEDVPQTPQSALSSQIVGQTNKKRKRDESSGTPNQGKPSKSMKYSRSPLDGKYVAPETSNQEVTRPEKDKTSPFWSAQSAKSSTTKPLPSQQSTQSEEEKKRLDRKKKKAQKKESKRRKRKEARARKSARNKKPVLQEISNSNRRKSDPSSSISGNIVASLKARRS